jgi:protein-S-isoprenylcysteine O-methyltransferase Ste14
MGVDVLKPLVYSLALLVVAGTWLLKYRALRRNRRYSEGRLPINRDHSFKVLGQFIFVAMNAVTLASFWTNSKVLLLVGFGEMLRATGMLALIAATLLYIRSLGYLGNNYSPCFDAHLPFRIVTHGPYRYIRHPLYLANILQGIGYALASGSLWVLLLAAYGIFGIVRAIVREESYLGKAFPEYEHYRTKTSRLIPFIY